MNLWSPVSLFGFSEWMFCHLSVDVLSPVSTQVTHNWAGFKGTLSSLLCCSSCELEMSFQADTDVFLSLMFSCSHGYLGCAVFMISLENSSCADLQ